MSGGEPRDAGTAGPAVVTLEWESGGMTVRPEDVGLLIAATVGAALARSLGAATTGSEQDHGEGHRGDQHEGQL